MRRRADRRPGRRPVLITAAPRSRYEEARERRAQYLATMALRAACFVVAVAVPVPAIRLVAVIGAVVLPYVAVVGANTVRRVGPDRDPSYFIPGPRRELPAGVGGRDDDR
jgi:Protein of unknown function (DUF3099)